MRRLARHLFTLCAAASLLLCVVVCVLWARSWSGMDYLHLRRVRGGLVETWRLESVDGRVRLSGERLLAGPAPGG